MASHLQRLNRGKPHLPQLCTTEGNGEDMPRRALLLHYRLTYFVHEC